MYYKIKQVIGLLKLRLVFALIKRHILTMIFLAVPEEFLHTLEIYTFQGLRVIGVAYKILGNANRDDLESIGR